MKTFRNYLIEKNIVVTGNKYGNVVYLAGGPGSGKSFAIKNLIDFSNHKTIDIDYWKEAILRLNAIKNNYMNLSHLDLRNPNDVFELHKFVKDRGIHDKYLELFFSDNRSELPNVVFDVTFKDLEGFYEKIKYVNEAGYDRKNIHLIWVLSDYEVSVQANRNRPRIVPDDILLSAHEKVATTMWSLLNGSFPSEIQGGVWILLNNPKTMTYYDDATGKKLNGIENPKIAIRGFEYIQVKKPGQALEKVNVALRNKIHSWMLANIPNTSNTAEIFQSALGK